MLIVLLRDQFWSRMSPFTGALGCRPMGVGFAFGGRCRRATTALLAVHVLVVLRPRLLARAPPCPEPVELARDVLCGPRPLRLVAVLGSLLDVLKESLHLVRSFEEHRLQLGKRRCGLHQEFFAFLHRCEPVHLEEIRYARLKLFLLAFQPTLAAVDSGDKIPDGDPKRQ